MPEKRDLMDARLGEALGPSRYILTREMAEFAASNLGFAEFESDASGNLIAPSCVSDSDYVAPWMEKFTAKEPVHTKAEHHYLNPPIIGKELTVTGKVTDRYTRRGRDFVTFETVTRDEDGREIVRSRNTLLIGL